MAANKRPIQPTPGLLEPLARAWHVNMTHGGGQTVAAHRCQIEDSGVLSFTNFPLESDEDAVLVRAFAARQWAEVELVDTPYSAPVQVRPPLADVCDARP